MVETRSSKRFAFLFLGAAFLALIAGHWIRPVNQVALTVAAPFAAVVNSVSSTVGDAISAVVEGPSLRAQNKKLQEEIAQLWRQNATLQQDAHDNRLLRSMLNFQKENNHLQLVPAMVIGSIGDPLDPYIVINRGRRDGLQEGMTVLQQNGYFVGSISDVTANAAKVLLLTSPSSSVAAMDLQTQAPGIVEGRFAQPFSPILNWAYTSASLHKGDLVVTSGQDNLYPRDVILGQITRVHHNNVNVFQTADIKPAADFQNLEMVQVVRNFVPQPVKYLQQ